MIGGPSLVFMSEPTHFVVIGISRSYVCSDVSQFKDVCRSLTWNGKRVDHYDDYLRNVDFFQNTLRSPEIRIFSPYARYDDMNLNFDTTRNQLIRLSKIHDATTVVFVLVPEIIAVEAKLTLNNIHVHQATDV